jgi:imidazole glycerol-phosphate synthase subunit HisF
MASTRVIPVLLLHDKGLNKTKNFEPWKYAGDPINAVRIFNEKEVDELVLLDIRATVDGRGPAFQDIERIAGEAFMPVAYGGGVRSIDDVQRLLAGGVEKVALNTILHDDLSVMERAATAFGSQSLIASIDVRRTGDDDWRVFTRSGRFDTGMGVVEAARRAVGAGAGEIMLTAIDREGTKSGYDLSLIEAVSKAVNVPVIAHGGAGTLEHLGQAAAHGAAAVAAGALFILIGRLDAVLITYPQRGTFEALP